MSRPTIPAPLLAVAAIFSVQFGNAFAGSFFAQVGPLGAAAMRLAFAAVILVAVVRPSLRGRDARTWLGIVLLGVGLAGMNCLIYLAIAEIPIGVAVTVELFGPLAVAAAGIRRPLDALWVLLALGGVALLGLESSGGLSLAGLALAAAAAAFWALYIVASSKLGPRVQGVDGIALAMVVAAVIVVPLGAVPATTAVVGAPWLLAVFAGVALVTSAVPYALEFIALKSMPARVFGVLSSLGPAVAALAGLLVLHQLLTLPQLAAIALVMAASIGVVLTARRRGAPPADPPLTASEPSPTPQL
ncbi:EamA family transporter [Herbiconiux moechotypicola]|uniref:DMT family transporter n=1 Tax=Herbiconiux moechotypicola TaxID=637393 RepID=A0ABP5Q626_9MICO|nr:EamA family transporter [Herbiconiux moechotypicola]MCS5728799.1 EamA family transporter [Herbiconiux moechotypicola]